jgi:prevent-host-death family protein
MGKVQENAMLPNIEQSEPLSNFTNDPAPILEKLRKSGEPLLLTRNGHEEIVVQDAASYRRILAEVDRLETLAAVKEGLRDVAAGRVQPLREAFADIAQKHGLSIAAE